MKLCETIVEARIKNQTLCKNLHTYAKEEKFSCKSQFPCKNRTLFLEKKSKNLRACLNFRAEFDINLLAKVIQFASQCKSQLLAFKSHLKTFHFQYHVDK